MIEMGVVENCDCDLVPEGMFGVLEVSGNYFGDFATREEASHFMAELQEDQESFRPAAQLNHRGY